MRDADKYILEHNFDAAKASLEKAKLIDANNPFIIAFEERIAIFERKKGTSASDASPGVAPQSEPADSTALQSKAAAASVSRESLEAQLRHEIEEEFKLRFTQELRHAEEKAVKLLEEEKLKLEVQRQSLAVKYDHQASAAREHMEKEYQLRLQHEITEAERKLEQQRTAHLLALEQKVRASLAEEYETKLREHSERMKLEQDELLENERQSFRNREASLTEQFNKKLLDALRKNESVIREQSLQQQKYDQDALQQKMKDEFQQVLIAEREKLNDQLAQTKATLEVSIRSEELRLQVESERNVRERVEALRKRDAEEMEHHRAQVRKQLEEEIRLHFEEQLASERLRIQEQADVALEQERKRLQEEFVTMLEAQNENLRTIRAEMRKEMEMTLLSKMERIAQEYDHKMDLLGVQIPQGKEERLALYRNRMQSSYTTGDPSVESAKSLMQLKELLELTFDDHLAIESDVRLDLYVKSVERKILTGELALNDTDGLEKLKQQFRISVEEYSKLEPYIISSYKRFASNGRILLVDDDTMLLRSLEQMLSDSGYLLVTATDIQEALKYLQTMSFDLILSDIKFANGEMDGFKFFRAVQQQPHLRSLPFIFMSSMEDGAVIQSGLQLGVDDYLTKPVDPDLLVAVIAGKLKRYRNLQRG